MTNYRKLHFFVTHEKSLFWTDKQLENGLCNYKSLCTEVSRKWDLDKKNVAFVRNSSYPDPKWLFSSNCKASENGPTHGDKTIKDWRIDCCRRSNVHSRWLNELDVDLIWQKSEISQLDIRAWVGKTWNGLWSLRTHRLWLRPEKTQHNIKVKLHVTCIVLKS